MKRDCDNEEKYEDFADSATTKSAQSVGLDIHSIPILVIEHVTAKTITATYKVEYRASNRYAHAIDRQSGYYKNNPVEDKRLIIVAITTEVEIINITVTYGKLPICENNAFGKPEIPFEQTGLSSVCGQHIHKLYIFSIAVVLCYCSCLLGFADIAHFAAEF
uniref:Uncharacterized protein n=1 Tax=Glossina pallidipes TaxID=7398 RepID=A0A1A9Z233_GLOPL